MEGEGTALVGKYDSKSAYTHSFGALHDQTRYADAWQKVDLRPGLQKAYSIGVKALTSTTGGEGTAGYA